MLMPLCCSILKLSVATRWPLMKTPKEPESTVWRAGVFVLSFLSLSAAFAARNAVKDRAKMSAAVQRVRIANFTRLLLVRCASQFFYAERLQLFGNLGSYVFYLFFRSVKPQRCCL